MLALPCALRANGQSSITRYGAVVRKNFHTGDLTTRFLDGKLDIGNTKVAGIIRVA